MTAAVGLGRGTDRLPSARAVPALGAAAGLAALVVTAGDDDDTMVLCPFRRCTGGYCPGCGATRATRRLLTGDIGGAWGQHPWVVLLAVQTVMLGAGFALMGSAARRPRASRIVVPLLVLNTLGPIALWLARLHAGSIPTGWL